MKTNTVILITTISFITHASALESTDLKSICLNDTNGKPQCGFIDNAANFIIQPKFEAIYSMSNYFKHGLEGVKYKGQWGYIDISGEWVIKPTFSRVTSFSKNGLARVKGSHRFSYGYSYINKKGLTEISQKTRIVLDGNFADNGLAAARNYRDFGYIDRNSRWIIKPQFDDVRAFDKNGIATAKLKKKWGYINDTGEWIIKPQFDIAMRFAVNGVAIVKVDGKFGYINTKGQWLVKPIYESAWGFSKGLAGVEIDGTWGFINTKGDVAITPQFEEVWSFSQYGLSAVKKDGKWGFINTKGKLVIKPQYTFANDSFSANGIAEVTQADGNRAYIDSQGNIIATVKKICKAEVLTKPNGDIIFPKHDINETCETKK